MIHTGDQCHLTHFRLPGLAHGTKGHTFTGTLLLPTVKISAVAAPAKANIELTESGVRLMATALPMSFLPFL